MAGELLKDLEAGTFHKLEGAAARLEQLAVHKFFKASGENIIAYDLIDYIGYSKLKVMPYDRVLACYNALARLDQDPAMIFGTYSNMREAWFDLFNQ